MRSGSSQDALANDEFIPAFLTPWEELLDRLWRLCTQDTSRLFISPSERCGTTPDCDTASSSRVPHSNSAIKKGSPMVHHKPWGQLFIAINFPCRWDPPITVNVGSGSDLGNANRTHLGCGKISKTIVDRNVEELVHSLHWLSCLNLACNLSQSFLIHADTFT